MKQYCAFIGLMFWGWGAQAQPAGGSKAGASREGNAAQVSVVSRPLSGPGNRYYTSNRLPLRPLSLIKLPIGSIRPSGWVLKYLELQRDGLTGQLGGISAWLDKQNNAWRSEERRVGKEC